ncbi:MAG: hypothetical protein HUU26_09350 [Gemmatimonadaceae bacterium]|nr:hypothetical protein [Gemmatimonadaceae bacterium]
MRACDGGTPPRAAEFRPREPRLPLLAECDVCGSEDLAEIRCKVICRNCRTILQSCADL